jgi:hypothetical protein
MPKQKKQWKEISAKEFEALPDSEKERHFQEIERGTPQQRRADSIPPSPAERATLQRIKKKLGRPKIGRGTKAIAITVEIDLLKQADARAKKLGVKRSELFSRSLRAMLESPRKSA